MKLRIGYELTYAFPQPTPVVLVVNVHESRAADAAIATTFGPNSLQSFRVWTDEISDRPG
jgi:hypothetical protein